MKQPHRFVPSGFRYAARVVVIGASAGGIDALLALLPALPPGYAVPVIAVLHLPEDHRSVLAEVFAARCRVPVREIADKQSLAPGAIHFAPPGYHLLIEPDGAFALNCDPPERFSRPSIDVLLDSAADAFGRALVAVLLTGANDDGARGMARAGEAGALTVVQDPQEARSPEMPQAAIAAAAPDFVLPLAEIRKLITQLEYLP